MNAKHIIKYENEQRRNKDIPANSERQSETERVGPY